MKKKTIPDHCNVIIVQIANVQNVINISNDQISKIILSKLFRQSAAMDKCMPLRNQYARVVEQYNYLFDR